MKTGDYEEDHLISLELGGSPTAEENLWPEPYDIQIAIPSATSSSSFEYVPAGAHEKDKVENYLHAQVCAGKISLADAQHEIATEWYDVYLSAGDKMTYGDE